LEDEIMFKVKILAYVIIIVLLLLSAISFACVSYLNDSNVVYVDINRYGVVINDSNNLILVTYDEFESIKKEFVNNYYFVNEPSVRCVGIQEFNDHFIIHDELNELQNNISRTIRKELNISNFVVVASLMRNCTGYPCPIHVLVYVNEANYRSDLKSLISDIVNTAYINTTYYKKGYCTSNPIITLFIIPSNPEMFNEDYRVDCHRNCGELIYSCIQDLLSNRTSNITLGLKGCYLVSHSVSASPLPHHAIGLYCKDYANKTITMDLIREFVAQNRDSIINITRLVKEKCCIGEKTLFVIILSNRPFRKVVALPEYIEDVDELNETSTSSQETKISIQEDNASNKEMYNESLCTENELASDESSASETLPEYKTGLHYHTITLLALILVMVCAMYLLIKYIRIHR